MDGKEGRGRVLGQRADEGRVASTRLHAWVESEGAFLCWPALWVTHDRPDLWSHRTRWTAGFGHHRISVVKTAALAADAAHTPGWDEAGGPEFLEWLHRHGQPRRDRRDVQAFFKNNDRWRALVALGGLSNYYTRVLVARELQGEVSK